MLKPLPEMQILDRDRDGSISPREVDYLVYAKVFDAIDMKNDGRLNEIEFQEFLKRLQVTVEDNLMAYIEKNLVGKSMDLLTIV